MGVMKMNSFLSRSCDNFGTVLKTDGTLGLWRYPTRGQYYVNINVLSGRGAVSLDDESWRALIADPRESSDCVYEPVTRVSSPHSYVREYVPGLQPEVWNYYSDHGSSRTGEQIPYVVHDGGAQRRGASKLLRSLKRFKQKLMTSKSKKVVQSYSNDKCSGSSSQILNCNSTSTTGLGDDKIQGMVANWEQCTKPCRHPLIKSAETAIDCQSMKVNRLSETTLSPKARLPSECHTYPDIIKSHSDTDTRRDAPKNDSQSMLCESPGLRQSGNSRGRKCNLKRQTVIRLPSNDKQMQAKPGLEEMQSFRQQVYQHTSTSSNKAVHCVRDSVAPRDRSPSHTFTDVPSHLTQSSTDIIMSPRNEKKSGTHKAMPPEVRDTYQPRRSVSPSKIPTSQCVRELSHPKTMSITKSTSSSTRVMSPTTTRITTPRAAAMSPSKEAVSPSMIKTIPKTRTLSPHRSTLSPTTNVSSAHGVSSTARSISPNRRALSPSERTMSPIRRTMSPTRRTLSPSRGSMSQIRPKSPSRIAMSPNGRLPSTRVTSPTRRTMSPTRRTMSPTRRTMSQARIIMSPTRIIMSPTRRTMSPTRSTKSPTRRSMSPTNSAMPPSRVVSPRRRTMSPMTRLSSPHTAISSGNPFPVHTNIAVENRNACQANINSNSVERTASYQTESDHVYLGSRQMNNRSSVENQDYGYSDIRPGVREELLYAEFSAGPPLHRSSIDDRNSLGLPSYHESILRTKTLPKTWRMANNIYSDQAKPSTSEDGCGRPSDRQQYSRVHNSHLINHSRSYSHLDGYQPVPGDRQSPMINSHRNSRHPHPTVSNEEPTRSAGRHGYRVGGRTSSSHSSCRRRRREHQLSPDDRSGYEEMSRSYDVHHKTLEEPSWQLNRQHRLSLSATSADGPEILI